MRDFEIFNQHGVWVVRGFKLEVNRRGDLLVWATQEEVVATFASGTWAHCLPIYPQAKQTEPPLKSTSSEPQPAMVGDGDRKR